MSPESKPDLALEIAHLLLIDVVGYSKLLVNEQVELLEELNRVVRGSDCFRAAEASGKLIRLPTGDGMALLFFNSPEQPVRCALEVSQALQNHPHIKVRMGIHSGPVNQIKDLNDNRNVAGPGINVAQRVLDCGDAGHILVSKHLADDLAQYRHWQPYLHDLGECEAKHGLRLHIVSLCKDGLGNSLPPEKFKRGRRWKSAPATIRPIQGVPSRFAIACAMFIFVCALAVGAFIFLHRPATPQALPVGEAPEKSIAVLPFESLGDDKQNTFFADGVHDEILTNLAKVADLKVISRTSVMQYKGGAPRNLREIGKTLGVAHILEGSVQRIGDRVRLHAQLIDARTDTYVWADEYNRELSDVFAIESELSEQIVAQLKLRLSPDEKAAIEQKPTADLAAYDLYARAKMMIERSVFNEPQKNLFGAVQLLNQAVKSDPSFMVAWYQLAHAHDQIYWRNFDQTPARLTMADAAVQAVRRLQPDSAEAHLALAKHLYWAYRDYEHARKEIDMARKLLPNEPMSYLLSSYLDRRQGNWEQSIRNVQRAIELDPQNFFSLQQLALTFEVLRRYSDSAAVLDKALTLAPNDAQLRIQRAELELEWRANSKPWHSMLEGMLAAKPENASAIADSRLALALYERDTGAAHSALKSIPEGTPLGVQSISVPRAWGEGQVAQLSGDSAAAKAAFKAARDQVDKVGRDLPENLAALGMIDAFLGRKKEAIEQGRRAAELLPATKDAIDGVAIMQCLAVTYAWSGKIDNAIEQLTATVKLPGYLSYGQLRLDPLWDPLRSDPRFDQIVASLAPK